MIISDAVISMGLRQGTCVASMLLRNGKSIRSLGDIIQMGAAELILRTTVPRQFTDGQHPFDYCNTANYWMRSESPYRPRLLYLMANFITDSAHPNNLFLSWLA